MNVKTDGWEYYTDDTGRRHWRWPATDRRVDAVNPRFEAGPRQKIGMPQQQQAQPSPLRVKGK